MRALSPIIRHFARRTDLPLVTSSLFLRQIGSTSRLPKFGISESHRIKRRRNDRAAWEHLHIARIRGALRAERTFMTRRFTSLAIAFSCNRHDKVNSERKLRFAGSVTLALLFTSAETLVENEYRSETHVYYSRNVVHARTEIILIEDRKTSARRATGVIHLSHAREHIQWFRMLPLTTSCAKNASKRDRAKMI